LAPKSHFILTYSGKVVWITGASSGIGEALALAFAREGAILVLSARNAGRLDGVRAACEALGAQAIVYPLDLANNGEAERWVREVLDKTGRIDVLVNNAGRSQRARALETTRETDRELMEINFFGPVHLTKAVLPVMWEQGGGQIAVVTSIVGKFGFPLRSTYSAAKHGLHGFFESLQAELAGSPVRITIVVPGRVRTQVSVNAARGDGSAYGVMDAGQAQGIPAGVCARKIIRALKRGRKEILIGGRETWLVHIRRFVPALYRRIVQNVSPT